MSEACYLILDQGGQSSRALVITASGDTLSGESVTVFTEHPAQDRVEQDPEALLESLQRAARKAVDALTPEQRKGLLAAALVTQRSSLLCWQSDSLKALTPVISWQDRRAHDWLEQLNVDPHWFRHHTGLYPNAHYGASKMHWCLNNVPEVLEASVDRKLRCGPVASYLAARLTDSSHTLLDPANAQRTGLYNVDLGDWDADLLQLFDIPETILPEVVKTVASYGVIKIGDKQVPLRLVNGDQSAAIFAHDTPDKQTAYVNVGTGAFVVAPWGEHNYPEQLLKSVVYKNDKTFFVVEGTVNGAGSALKWAQEKLHIPDIAELDHWAKVCTDVPLFINAVGGIGSPFWRPGFQSEFTGSSEERVWSDQQKMVAVLESIIFLLQSNLTLMQAHGLNLERLIVSGGLSHLEAFCQKLADISRLPVWRPNEVEASARGAAFLLAHHNTSDKLHKRSWKTMPGKTYHPGSSGQETLNQRFGRWREALQARM